MRVVRRRDDRGAVLVIVTAFVVVAVIFMAFVVDIGNQRQNRRQLNSGTDSAALALSQQWIADPNNFTDGYSCGSDAIGTRLIMNNDPNGVPPTWQCILSDVVNYRSGVLTVRSEEAVDYAFGGVTGVDSGGTGSLTSVLVQPVVGGGVRPVALCRDTFDTSTWLPLLNEDGDQIGYRNPTPSADTFTLTNEFSGPDDGPCDVSGNWNTVLLRLDNTCPGQENNANASEFEEQYENGSPFDVAVNDCVSRRTGAGALNSTDLQSIVGKVVWLPTFDNAEGGGAGIFLVRGFLEVYVRGVYEPRGSIKEFELEPRRYLTSGVCCLVGENNAVRQVCDVGTIGGGVGAVDSECVARDLSTNPEEPYVPPEADECGAVQTINRTPNTYQDQRGQANQSLSATAAIEGECGTLEYVLIRESDGQVFSIPGPHAAPSMSASVPNTSSAWANGWFRVEVWNDEDPLASHRFELG